MDSNCCLSQGCQVLVTVKCQTLFFLKLGFTIKTSVDFKKGQLLYKF